MKKFLALVMALCMVFALCAVSAYADDPVTLTYAEVNPLDGTIVGEMAKAFKAKVEELSGGSIIIDLQGGGESDPDVDRGIQAITTAQYANGLSFVQKDSLNLIVKAVELDQTYSTDEKLKIYELLSQLSNCGPDQRDRYAKKLRKVLK